MNNMQLLQQASVYCSYQAVHGDNTYIAQAWSAFGEMFRMAHEDIRIGRASMYRASLINCAKFIDEYMREIQTDPEPNDDPEAT